MGTIEIYEKAETAVLQSLLKNYENLLEENELCVDDAKYKNENCVELQKVSDDYEIDISLLRMELNRRLWSDEV